MAGFHGRFPDLTFLLLAIAHDAECLVLLAVELSRQRNPHCDAQALPQRSRRNFHSRQLEPMRMPLERRPQLAQQHHVIHRAETGKRQAQVQAGRLVSGGPDDAIAVRPRRIPRIMIRHPQIQRRRDVHDRQRSARVPRPRRAQRHQVVAAHQVCRVFQLFNGIVAKILAGRGILDRHSLILRAGLGQNRASADPSRRV